MIPEMSVDTKALPYYSWPDRLGICFPVVALIWSWILGNSMHLVYLPWAPYAMLALTVWSMVLLTRMCRGDKEDEFPGGNWGMSCVVFVSVVAVVWMALNVVGLGILKFSYLPGVLMVIFLINHLLYASRDRLPLVTYLLGGLAFAYGCAVPVWYSAAIYSLPGFMVDRRTLCLGLLMFICILAGELWKRERKDAEVYAEMDWEEEEARIMVWISVPLMIIAAFSLFQAYVLGTSSEWVYYSIAISAILVHVLSRHHLKFSLYQLRLLLFVCMVVPAVVNLF